MIDLFLRKGTEKGVIEAVFHSESSNLKKVLHEHDLDLDEENLLVITRVIYLMEKVLLGLMEEQLNYLY